MKKILFFSLVMITSLCFSYAQDSTNSLVLKQDETNGDAYYEEVIQVSDLKQDELFKTAKTWVLAHMQTVDNNINFDDKEFTIVNSGSLKLEKIHRVVPDNPIVTFKFHIWLKDNKYKIRIDNIMASWLETPINKAAAEKIKKYLELNDKKIESNIKEQINNNLYSFVNGFKKGMVIKSGTKNDW